MDCEYSDTNHPRSSRRQSSDEPQFIIEGILTVLIAVGGYMLLVPFPDDKPDKCWGFLTEREVAWVIARVEADRGDTQTEPFNLVKFLKPASDFKIWGFALIFCCLTTITYALAYFLPISESEQIPTKFCMLTFSSPS